ncbi:hypothetical protein LOTGIDRAFT_149649 [Lottia gigantea]|uniref:Calponin-homology (CH) domain-containing protein n=1 Tax=Lottia gigantea TaxID=225164 RepID=V4AD92_LOTGI|nr:hypothetical protein LOTGIDRAFT_149649 [Lottia gigantea]ESP01959.1 hypothetical protein LOTGIDRAFT_149649 [Lottia gigantea]
MANRPKGYGLTHEINRKIAGKYDTELEQEARIWIEAILGRELKPGSDSSQPLGMHDFGSALKDGTVLCELMNQIQPGSIKRVNTTTMAFKQMENISNFLQAIEKYGVSKVDSFQTVDLYEGQNMTQVVNGLHALGRKAQKNGYSGPRLGLKEAEANPRNFTEEQLKAGEGVIGLQMGSNAGASQAGMNFGKSRHILD